MWICKTYVAHEFVWNVFVNVFQDFGQNMKTWGFLLNACRGVCFFMPLDNACICAAAVKRKHKSKAANSKTQQWNNIGKIGKPISFKARTPMDSIGRAYNNVYISNRIFKINNKINYRTNKDSCLFHVTVNSSRYLKWNLSSSFAKVFPVQSVVKVFPPAIKYKTESNNESNLSLIGF